MHVIIHILSLLILILHSTYSNENESDLTISGDVASISKIADQHSKVDPIDLNFGSKLLSQLKDRQISDNVNENYLFLDPVLEDPWFCKRDFTKPCPIDFLHLTNTNEVTNPNGKCVPRSTYTGGCGSEDFSDTSIQYKMRWSIRCGTNWPCDKNYRPDYSQPCPEFWIMKDGKCSPTFEYTGPCNEPINFINFNKRQREDWSRYCHSFWPGLTSKPIKTSGPAIDLGNTNARLFD